MHRGQRRETVLGSVYDCAAKALRIRLLSFCHSLAGFVAHCDDDFQAPKFERFEPEPGRKKSRSDCNAASSAISSHLVA